MPGLAARVPLRATGAADAVLVRPVARPGADAAQAPGNQTAVYCSMASRSPVVTAPSHGGRPVLGGTQDADIAGMGGALSVPMGSVR
ncbi:hypothetical protein ACIOC2_14795 [Streptomyces sp. NPDC088337]|uniref:hypothetical protein n=1 Tax=unclassified Streptomyces TaxID=2593676 RepID=UPI0037F5B669